MVKYHTKFRLLAASLMTVFLLANAPSLQATAFQDSGPSFRVKHDKWEDKHDKWEDKKEQNRRVPEGSPGAILILAAGSLGGAVLIWRRKRRAIVA